MLKTWPSVLSSLLINSTARSLFSFSYMLKVYRITQYMHDYRKFQYTDYQPDAHRSGCIYGPPTCIPVPNSRQPLTFNKKLSYRRVTARCALSVVILPIAMQQCRNYVYDKSWPNWWYEVGGLVGGNVSWTMCTQLWRDRVGSHCLRCHKQTDDGRIVYITCIPTTCCGKIF